MPAAKLHANDMPARCSRRTTRKPERADCGAMYGTITDRNRERRLPHGLHAHRIGRASIRRSISSSSREFCKPMLTRARLAVQRRQHSGGHVTLTRGRSSTTFMYARCPIRFKRRSIALASSSTSKLKFVASLRPNGHEFGKNKPNRCSKAMSRGSGRRSKLCRRSLMRPRRAITRPTSGSR